MGRIIWSWTRVVVVPVMGLVLLFGGCAETMTEGDKAMMKEKGMMKEEGMMKKDGEMMKEEKGTMEKK